MSAATDVFRRDSDLESGAAVRCSRAARGLRGGAVLSRSQIATAAIRAKTGALVLFLAITFLAACGGGGSSSEQPPPPPPPPPQTNNPTPFVTSLSPNSTNVGAAAFQLTVDGENFVSGATIEWNGNPVTTNYVSSTQVQAQIPATDVASAGTAMVSVTNPAPGGGNSGEAEFAINATSNPLPTITMLNPISVTAGSSSSLLTVTGTNLIPNSAVQWNGTAIATTYLSATQIEAQIPSSDLQNAGTAEVTVFNPGPGGGTSGQLAFAVGAAPMVVHELANDLVWDATHQVIYLSVPSLAGANGNSVAALDPTTGAIQSSQFVGSEPDFLAISDDDQFLYVALDGSSSVQRLALPDLTPDISYSLGAYSSVGPTFAVDLEVAPGLPHTTGVSRGAFQISPYALAGIVVYDDATQRPTIAVAPGPIYDSMQWVSDASIFANNSETTLFDMYSLAVSGSGVSQIADYPGIFPGFGTTIHYDSGTGLLYGDDGSVANPATGQQAGGYTASGLMIPDSTLNTAFFLGQTQAQIGTQDFTIETFNLTNFSPQAEFVVPGVQGNPLHFIRWGANGLAFNDDAGFVYILSNQLGAGNGAQAVKATGQLMPVMNSRWAPRVVRASRAVPIPRSRVKRPSSAQARAAETTVSNPSPSISALSPNTVSVGDSAFTLTVTGSNFNSLSTIEWNGSPLSTELVTTTELQAQVGLGDVAAAGTDAVTVVNPSPGGGTSNSVNFTVVSPSSSNMPVLTNLLPDYAMAGGAGFTLGVIGGNTSASSQIQWNGTSLPTTLNGAVLQAQISAADIASPGFAEITIFNPGSGGGTSNPLPFQILYQPMMISQVTNDIVWDPVNQVFYISVPGSASANANYICVLNPTSGAISNCQSGGNEPDRLAISDDSSYLYVGEDGTGSVQRYILPTLTPDISYSLGTYSNNGADFIALDLQVAPGAPHTTAVSKGVLNLEPSAEGGLAIFDDATQRPNIAPGWDTPPNGKTYDSIQWGADATAIYAADTENITNGFDFYTLTVNSSGVSLDQDYPSVFWSPGAITYDRGNGLVYSNDGFHAVSPSTGLPVGIFELGAENPMAPDSTLNIVFMPAQYVWQEQQNFTLDLFDINTYLLVSQIPFYSGSNGLHGIRRVLRWGTNGLALQDPTGTIYIFSGSFVTAAAATRPRAHGLAER